MASIKFRHEGASAKLVQLDPYIWAVGNVYSRTRNQGHASAVMRQITDHADKHGLTLTLVVQQYGYSDPLAVDNKGLVKFYSKFGFVLEPARDWPLTMSRQPSQELHVL